MGSRFAAVAVALMLSAGVTTASAAPDRAAARQVTNLAGNTWTYHAQIDGKGGVDRIVIVGGKDLTVGKYQLDQGYGHFTVTVYFAGSTHSASSRQFLTYDSVRTPFTPWLGATNLDQQGGKEILVGYSTGTEQLFTALTYQGGRLVVLSSPTGPNWVDGEVSAYEFGGWLCTSDGVESRAVESTSSDNKHYRISLDDYVYRAGSWVRSHHSESTVAATADGNAPAATAAYAGFDCPGLPN
jgi:hypothetical protein